MRWDTIFSSRGVTVFSYCQALFSSYFGPFRILLFCIFHLLYLKLQRWQHKCDQLAYNSCKTVSPQLRKQKITFFRNRSQVDSNPPPQGKSSNHSANLAILRKIKNGDETFCNIHFFLGFICPSRPMCKYSSGTKMT